MYVVCVTFKILPGQIDRFLPMVEAQATASVTREPGCQKFDVCGGGVENEVFLYEHYVDEAAFDAHLETRHYHDFDQATAGLVEDKIVKTYHWVKGGEELL